MRRRKRDLVAGWVVYPMGDLLAQFITRDINPFRVLVIALAGGLIYRYEVPWWFYKISRFEFAEVTPQHHPIVRFLIRSPIDRHFNWLGPTIGALIYFNPLWIARHMLFIQLGTDPSAFLDPLPLLRDVVILGAKSFLINFPVSFTGNYIIQLRMPLRHRFVASSILSALLSAAYALAYRYLR